MSKSRYELILLVLAALAAAALWRDQPKCIDGSPMGPRIGSVIKVAGC